MKTNKMNPKNSWEKLYRRGEYKGRYPTEDIIRFIQSHFSDQKARKNIKILDWGVGTGRHTRYLAGEGFSTYGVETSGSGVEMTKRWLEKDGLSAQVSKINGIKLPYADNFFDAVIECASLQHNKLGQIKKIISEMKRVLKPGGYIFSWCKAKQDSLFKEGKEIEKNTFDIKNSAETPDTIIHFFSERELRLLWKQFSDIKIEYTERTINDMTRKVSHFIVSAKK